MKVVFLYSLLLILTAGLFVHGSEPLPALESAFLANLKLAVTKQDYALFATLLDNDGDEQATDSARQLASVEPYNLIFSNLQRTYQFGPSGELGLGIEKLTVLKIHGAQLSQSTETSPLVAVLKVNLPHHLVITPRPDSASPDWMPIKRYEDTSAVIPLIKKDGKLLIVEAGPAPSG